MLGKKKKETEKWGRRQEGIRWLLSDMEEKREEKLKAWRKECDEENVGRYVAYK